MQLRDLAREQFVSLTTFRRTGVGVPTPVWVAGDGDDLVLFTPDGTGKLKRLAHTSRVELSPCSRGGKVADDAPVVAGVATIVRDEAEVAQFHGLLARKYGLQFKAVMIIERLIRRGRVPARVGIRVRTAPATPTVD